MNDSEAQNFGVDEVLAHDKRYDRADEFIEAIVGLWDSWDDDALVIDRASGYFADPDKVHQLDFKGEWFDVRGPLTVPRSPQGRPVFLQAGSSGRGREFAARWAEVIFMGDPDIERRPGPLQGSEGAGGGRRARPADAVKMLPMVYTVIGESPAHAEEREQMFLNDFVDPMASLTLLSELMNHDFSGLPLDAPITDELIENVQGIRGLVQNLRQHIGGDTVTLADLAGHRATLLQGPRFVGTAVGGRRPDGGVVHDRRVRRLRDRRDPLARAPTRTSCGWSCPSSSAGAVFRDRYTGATLRENLGLERPESSYRG